MEKEQVVLNNLEQDLVQYIVRVRIAAILEIIHLWIILAIVSVVLEILFSFNYMLIKISTPIFIICIILSLVNEFVLRNKIKKKEYIIRNDHLLQKKDCRQGSTVHFSYRPHRLYFAKGYFDLPVCISYKWSSIYSMNEREIYDSSSVGDTFILVELKGKILSVYNEKFFKLST